MDKKDPGLERSSKRLKRSDSQQPSEQTFNMTCQTHGGSPDAKQPDVISDLKKPQSPEPLIGDEGTTPWDRDHLPFKHVPCDFCNKERWNDVYDPDFEVADLGDGLFLGASDPAYCPYNLQKLGLTHILQVFD
jgi:hypothetical protein